LRPSKPSAMRISGFTVAFPQERGHAAARRQRTDIVEGLIMDLGSASSMPERE
jgi:hypothetical protein